MRRITYKNPSNQRESLNILRMIRSHENPILVAFRGRLKYQHAAGVTTSAAGLASIWIRDLRFYAGADATPAQIEDARKVLTRLAGVIG